MIQGWLLPKRKKTLPLLAKKLTRFVICRLTIEHVFTENVVQAAAGVREGKEDFKQDVKKELRK